MLGTMKSLKRVNMCVSRNLPHIFGTMKIRLKDMRVQKIYYNFLGSWHK